MAARNRRVSVRLLMANRSATASMPMTSPYRSSSQLWILSASSAFDGQRYHGDADVLKIQSWLEERYGEVAGIESVAERFAMSSRTLTRRFRAATGDSPSDYLRRVRIEAAKELLRTSDLTVAEIASGVGYRDIGAFYDAFGKQTGQRPGAYRNSAWVAPWDDNRHGTR